MAKTQEVGIYATAAEPKAWADSVPVFCAHDEIVAIDKLIPNPKNPNTHPDDQIKALAKIIRGTGWRGAITVSKRSGFIVKGHGRLLAAQLNELTEVPVDYQEYASEAEEYADMVADNRLSELSQIDSKLLADLMADVDTGEIPMEMTGYTEKEYESLITGLSEAQHDKELKCDPDQIPELPAQPVTHRGDIWILGNHRVMCGDSTSSKDRDLLLDGDEPEVLLTDPPYCSGGQKEAGKSTGSIGTARKDGKQPMIANDILSTRGYQNLIAAALNGIPCLYGYIFTDWRMWVYLFDLVESSGMGVKSMIVWDKGTPGMGVGWRSQHELLMFAARATTHFDGHKGYGNVLNCTRSGNDLHPTQKPAELIGAVVDNMGWAKGFYDPFGGSGTTLIACETKGAKSYTMELTPAYTDVIVKRYIAATGATRIRCIREGVELGRDDITGIFTE